MHFRYLSLILSASAVLALPTIDPSNDLGGHTFLTGTHGMGSVEPQGVHHPRAVTGILARTEHLKTPLEHLPDPNKFGLGRDEHNAPLDAGLEHLSGEHGAPKPKPNEMKPGATPEKRQVTPPKKHVKAPIRAGIKPNKRGVDASAKEKAPYFPKTPIDLPETPHSDKPVKATVERDVTANAAVHPPPPHGNQGNKYPVENKAVQQNTAPGKTPSKVTVTRNHTDADAHVEPEPKDAIQKSHVEAVTHDH